jgi:microcystin degradation protein MlrC
MTEYAVVVGEFSHETNTFAPGRTGREAFAERREHLGGFADKLRGTNTPVGGFVDAADERGVKLVETVAAAATPGGLVTADAYDRYTGEILSTVRERTDEVDGVALSLHGAMVPADGELLDGERTFDGEGPLLAAVREAVSPDVPVVATLDLHANVTDEMCEAADALVAFESYPHTDTAETGRRAMRLLADLLADGRDLATAVERPPLLAHGPLQNTREGPMAAVMARAREVEERAAVEKVSVCPGFHKADVPAMGSSVVAVGDDAAAAADAAEAVATDLWDRREAFVGSFPGPGEAVREAADAAASGSPDAGPVVLADTGDNPGGGGTADETAVLRELLDAGATDAGVAILRDPEAVADCVEAGVGERVALSLGGKSEGSATDPIRNVEGYVAAVTDGRFRNTGPMGTGTENRLGRTVLLRCGDGNGTSARGDAAPEREDGVSVVVTENRLQPLDAELWRHVGVQPERFDLVAVKSNNHYRADYEPIANEVVVVDSPGVAAFDPARYDYRRIRRPIFPLDDVPADAYPDRE